MQFPSSVDLPCQPNLLKQVRGMCYNGLLFGSIDYTKSKTSKLEQMQNPSSVDYPVGLTCLDIFVVCVNGLLFGSIDYTKSKTSKLEQIQFPSSVDLPCQPNLLRHFRGYVL